MLSTSAYYDYGSPYTSASGATVHTSGYGAAYHGLQGFQLEGVEALIATLIQYDALRKTLEYDGGALSLVKDLSILLKSKIKISGPYSKAMVCLKEPDQLRAALTTVGQTEVKFNVRRLDHGLPAYYLARVHQDWWGIYSLIVEDLHLSHGYPLLDPRFARIMTYGTERYHLRLSLFRSQLRQHFEDAGDRVEAEIDALLYDLGRCIFQGAWHTDQRFAFAFAEAFDLPELRNAIELVYLSLSCDLSALRRFLTPLMRDFFHFCYPNSGMKRLLSNLDTMTGADMSDMARRGLEAYNDLADALNATLAEEVDWASAWHGSMPLWQILVANVNRLDLINHQLRDQTKVRDALNVLKEKAAMCMGHLIQENTET